MIKSDGSTASYYELPEDAKELQDLIEYRNMSYSLGNVFKACYRLGEKEGADLLYDLNKIVFFANRMIDQEKKRQAPDRPKFKLKDLLEPTTKEDAFITLYQRMRASGKYEDNYEPDNQIDLFAYWDESQMYRTEDTK